MYPEPLEEGAHTAPSSLSSTAPAFDYAGFYDVLSPDPLLRRQHQHTLPMPPPPIAPPLEVAIPISSTGAPLGDRPTSSLVPDMTSRLNESPEVLPPPPTVPLPLIEETTTGGSPVPKSPATKSDSSQTASEKSQSMAKKSKKTRKRSSFSLNEDFTSGFLVFLSGLALGVFLSLIGVIIAIVLAHRGFRQSHRAWMFVGLSLGVVANAVVISVILA